MSHATLSRTLKQMRSHLNYSEGPNNDNIFAKEVGHRNHEAWCATFQCAVSREVSDRLLHESAGAGELLRAYHDAGKAGHKPKIGALVGFAFPGESGAGRFMGINHVGRVESIRSDGAIITIEGNTNYAGSRSGGMVLRKVRRANIALYGYVDYAPETVVPKPTVIVPKHTARPPKWWTHTTKVGDVHQEVASIRKRLKMPPGVTFTPGVVTGVKYVQLKHHLPVTGRVDAYTAEVIG